MSTRRSSGSSSRSFQHRTLLAVNVTAVAGLALSGCGATSTASRPHPLGGSSGPGSTASSEASRGTDPAVDTDVAPASLRVNVRRGAGDVAVDRVLRVQATDGTLTRVSLTSKAGAVAGTIDPARTSWSADGLLEPGVDYTLRSAATSADGTLVHRRVAFHTQDLTLDEQTYPSVSPLAGQTVGVGMPVVVHFDLPVADEAAFEKHMHVTSTPAQAGSWHWMSNTEAHWRPKTYWKADTDVHVAIDVNSVPAGDGIYGQESRDLSFHVGSATIMKVNAVTDQMQVFSDGELLRTIPITTGKAGFTTRSGVKVISQKYTDIAMNSETVGIGGSEAYNLSDVKYAMRLTNSGEFIHAAPWSVASQGHDNVSHGCTGMSTENAEWLFGISKVGDVVETTGTDKPMTLDNGYGDWNAGFKAYATGSAL